jgi:signal transduction histidine kinase
VKGDAARPSRGLWREATFVLPLALLLFAGLGLATLASYRGAVERFAIEREAEARAAAERIAETLAQGGPRGLERHLRSLPPGAAIAILDDSGQTLESLGYAAGGDVSSAAILAALPAAPDALGPESVGWDAVVALAPFLVRRDGATEERRFLRLDLPAATLAAQRRSLALLTPLVVVASIAAALVVALFFRALVRPYETLLARARALPGAESADERDELAFLVRTFDRALASLGVSDRVGGGDLAPLAGELGRTLDGGFLLLDAEGRLLVATPAAIELLGAGAPAPGTPLVDALVGAPAENEALAHALATGTALPRATFRLQPAGGATAEAESPRAIGVTVEPLRGEGARLRGFLVVAADVSASERAQARERLAEGLAQLGELAAGVAHELRNGLAALGGWLQLLGRRPLEPEAAECARELEHETRQLARVVDEFLAFARPGTRRLEPVDLAELVRRAARDPSGGGAEIRLRIAVEPAPIAGDELLLERALRNLLANATAANADAASAEPVEIALARSGDRFEVEIADRGPGVPAALRERLFEPFASGRSGGVGLGLALARRIVVLHGGEIALDDRAGGGTVVRLRLPADTFATVGSGRLDSEAAADGPSVAPKS